MQTSSGEDVESGQVQSGRHPKPERDQVSGRTKRSEYLSNFRRVYGRATALDRDRVRGNGRLGSVPAILSQQERQHKTVRRSAYKVGC